MLFSPVGLVTAVYDLCHTVALMWQAYSCRVCKFLAL